MEISLESKYYRYYAKMMKPHPKLEGVNWAVMNGENMTVVVFEERPGQVRVSTDVKTPFTGGERHHHDDIEQICLFLGFSEDTPDEVKIAGYRTLRCVGDEIGIFGSGIVQWIPPGTDHDIPVPPDILSKFEQEGLFPDGYPEGTVIYTADVFSPARPEYYEYWKSL